MLIAAIDIETTGLQRSCSMTELAVCTSNDAEVLWRAPDHLVIRGEVIHCTVDRLLTVLHPWLHEQLLVGYNIFFDLRRLATFQGACTLTILAIDLLPLAQRLMQRHAPPRLVEACAHFGVPVEGPEHQARHDARRALALAQCLSHELPLSPLRVHLGRLL